MRFLSPTTSSVKNSCRSSSIATIRKPSGSPKMIGIVYWMTLRQLLHLNRQRLCWRGPSIGSVNIFRHFPSTTCQAGRLTKERRIKMLSKASSRGIKGYNCWFGPLMATLSSSMKSLRRSHWTTILANCGGTMVWAPREFYSVKSSFGTTLTLSTSICFDWINTSRLLQSILIY